MKRVASRVQIALDTHKAHADQLSEAFSLFTSSEGGTLQDIEDWGANVALRDCVFVGHTNTDMDSIGSAIGAAALFGGTAARASEVNTETSFALEYWGFQAPPPFLEVAMDRDVCLVDHNQASQMAQGLNQSKIRGIIDHHALQSGIVTTSTPIYVDIRPYGSACTIVAHSYIRYKRPLAKNVAGLLLSGILSDTLNLHSPTTMKMDEIMVALLSRIAEVKDVTAYAQRMFKAKSKDLLTIGTHGLVRGDFKIFEIDGADKGPRGGKWRVGFGVVESVAAAEVLALTDDILLECRALKVESSLDIMFFAIVNIEMLSSKLLICGHTEAELAREVFAGPYDNHTAPAQISRVTSIPQHECVMDLGKRVSRKLDFIPPISDRLSRGWEPSPPPYQEKEEFGDLFVDHSSGCCGIIRRHSSRTLESPQ